MMKTFLRYEKKSNRSSFCRLTLMKKPQVSGTVTVTVDMTKTLLLQAVTMQVEVTFMFGQD